MSDEAVKRRIAHAKESAKQRCRELGYEIINSDNEIFCFIASRAGIYERKIRIVLDDIDRQDVELIKRIRILPNQTKEIWCRPFGKRGWKTVELDFENKRCQ